MKKLILNVLKGLLVIILFTGGSIVLSTSGVKSISVAKAAVKDSDVITYLTGLGYTIVTLNEIPNSDNWIAHTILDGRDFWTTVYVEGTNILTHEDQQY